MVNVLAKVKFDRAMSDFGCDDSNVEDFKSNAFISIIGCIYPEIEPDKYCFSYFSKNHDNVLICRFDDTEVKGDFERPISDAQAQEIAKFIMKRKDRNFVVHCAAGISRSGAVGKIISEVQGDKYDKFILHNPNVHPNSLVYSKVKKYLQ